MLCFQGVQILAAKLPNAIMYGIPTKDFNHVDFIAGKNNNRLINQPILKLFKKHA